MSESRTISDKVYDLLLLIAAAVGVCAVLVGAFIFANIHHMNPLWVFLSMISIGFLAAVWEDYRKQFRSRRFVFFVFGWLLINMVLVVTILGSFGWLVLVPALLVEQALFYLSANWLFGIQVPGRRRS